MKEKYNFFEILFCLITSLILFLGIYFLFIKKHMDDYFRITSIICVQNELFKMEKDALIRQNKKCVTVNDKIYIYNNNGDLKKAY